MTTLNDINMSILNMVKDKKLSKDSAFQLLKDLNQLQARNEDRDIAVIGMAAKLPGAKNIDEYWDVLENGKCVIGPPSHIRKIDTDKILLKMNYGKEVNYVPGGYLEEIDKFDPEFFGISPNEAVNMDPCERIFMETSYEAIEDSGYGGNRIFNTNTGVFVGIDHTSNNMISYLDVQGTISYSSMMGSYSSFLSSRISYAFNLVGPSIVFDTACSSGLVAVHSACKSIINGESDMAIAGGINVLLSLNSENGYMSMFESKDRVVRPFHKDASGTIWGEGVGVVVLKSLSKAIKDGDNIHAVIKGSAINNNGKGSSLVSLNGESHKKVIKKAIEVSKINPESISYAEMHSSGTALGDSIEFSAMASVFKQYTKKNQYCAIGTVKANIGHAVAFSGVAALIKVILSIKNKCIPPTLNVSEVNPLLNIQKSPFYIAKNLIPWEIENDKRRACINSFGFNGTNCHMIVEEAPEKNIESIASVYPFIFTLSAKDELSFKGLIEKYINFFSYNSQMSYEDICYTSNIGRGHYSHRLAIICSNYNDLMNKLLIFKENEYNTCEEKLIFYKYHKKINNKKTKEHAKVYNDEIKALSNEAALIVNKFASSTRKDETDLAKLSENYVCGADINWKEIYKNTSRRVVTLPTYSFNNRRFWPEISVNIDNYSERTSNEFKNDKNKIITVEVTGRENNDYTELEMKLSQIWGNILGISKISIYDNFIELGGDSLLAMIISTVISENIQININAACILENVNIYQLSNYIEEQLSTEDSLNKFQLIEPIEEREHYILSNAQKRIYTIETLNDIKNTSYSVPISINIEGNIDVEKVKKAFEIIINRHETLRSSFEMINNEAVAIVHKRVEFEVDYIEVQNEDIDILINNYIKPFDLRVPPLLRTALFKVKDEKYVLLIDMHHIITDGTSCSIILKDFINIICGNTKLPDIPIQYKDYAAWQYHEGRVMEIKEQEKYWLNKFSTDIPVLNLPTDFPRQPIKSFEGGTFNFELGKEETKKIKELAAQENVTMFMMFLSIFNILLSKYSGDESIVVGSVVQGRNHPQLQNIVGMFVNTVAIMNNPKQDKSFLQFLKEVKENTLEVFKNQDYQFDELVKKLNTNRDMSRNPIFDVCFSFQNMYVPTIEVEGIKISSHDFSKKTSQFDLTLLCNEYDERIRFSLEFCTKLFMQETIKTMMDHLIEIVNFVILDKHIRLGDIVLTDNLSFELGNKEIDVDFNF